jgi:hypothetical protein
LTLAQKDTGQHIPPGIVGRFADTFLPERHCLRRAAAMVDAMAATTSLDPPTRSQKVTFETAI